LTIDTPFLIMVPVQKDVSSNSWIKHTGGK
jgi:hypothetical protein